MFIKRGKMSWICILMLVAVAAIEVDFANGHNSVHMERSVHRKRSRDWGHWRGITRADNGNSNKQKRGHRLKQNVGRTSRNLAEANQKFSVSMYRMLEVNNPNFVFSPFSVHMALSMMSMGATQQTAKEMLHVLGLEMMEKQNVHQDYATLLQSLRHLSNILFNLTNAVFVKPSFTIKDAFKTGLSKFYQAGFDHFQYNAPGGPETPINQLVSNVTAGKIPNLLQKGFITSHTVMIILNAIYFKGDWMNKFDAKLTKEENFDVTKYIKVKVLMMTKVGSYKYKENSQLKAKILELPYANTQFSMFIILPIQRNDLDAVTERVNSDSLTSAINSLKNSEVNIFLPKFKIENKLNLQNTLIHMGMVKAFSVKDATFTEISSHHGLYISDVIQMAMIEVTEEGTVAAAATVIRTMKKSKPKRYTFRADHPFMYFIRDNVNHMILFGGKYSGRI